MAIEIITEIKPINDQKFPIVDTDYVKGGRVTVTDITGLYNIDDRVRKEGMIGYVQSEGKSYRLEGGTSNANWVAEDLIVQRYEHIQLVGSSTWYITHNLGREPIIQAYNDSNLPITGAISITSTGVSCNLEFNFAVAGKAYLT